MCIYIYMDTAICVYTHMYTYSYILFFFLDKSLVIIAQVVWNSKSSCLRYYLLELIAMCYRPWFLINILESGTTDTWPSWHPNKYLWKRKKPYRCISDLLIVSIILRQHLRYKANHNMLVNIVCQLGWSKTQCFSEQQFILSTKLVDPSKALYLCNTGRPHPVKVFWEQPEATWEKKEFYC